MSEESEITVCRYAPHGVAPFTCKQYVPCVTCDEDPDKKYCGNYRFLRGIERESL
jgi:hypothetical protein